MWGRMMATLGAELPNTNANVQTTVPLGYAEPANEVHGPALGRHASSAPSATARRSGRSRTTGSTRTRCTSTCSTCSSSTGSAGTARSTRRRPTRWAGRTRCSCTRWRTRSSRCGRVLPALPFKIPNSVRPIDPAMPIGSPISTFNPITGQAVTVPNSNVDYGWEYVWHCHMLSHEEMDFMRPVIVHGAPAVPTGLAGDARLHLGRPDLGPARHRATPRCRTTRCSGRPRRTSAPGVTNLVDATTDPAMTQTSYTDTGLRPLTTYYYRVRSESTVGYSGWSNRLTAQTVLAAARPASARPAPPLRASRAPRSAGPPLTCLPASRSPTSVQRSTSATFTGHRGDGGPGAHQLDRPHHGRQPVHDLLPAAVRGDQQPRHGPVAPGRRRSSWRRPRPV